VLRDSACSLLQVVDEDLSPQFMLDIGYEVDSQLERDEVFRSLSLKEQSLRVFLGEQIHSLQMVMAADSVQVFEDDECLLPDEEDKDLALVGEDDDLSPPRFCFILLMRCCLSWTGLRYSGRCRLKSFLSATSLLSRSVPYSWSLKSKMARVHPWLKKPPPRPTTHDRIRNPSTLLQLVAALLLLASPRMLPCLEMVGRWSF
jgi:hypothetical protein